MKSNTDVFSTKRNSLSYPSTNTTTVEPPSSFLLKQSNRRSCVTDCNLLTPKHYITTPDATCMMYTCTSEFLALHNSVIPDNIPINVNYVITIEISSIIN